MELFAGGLLHVVTTTGGWMWDAFNFRTVVIQYPPWRPSLQTSFPFNSFHTLKFGAICYELIVCDRAIKRDNKH